MPVIYCCYENDTYLACYNTLDDANYNLSRAIEEKARMNVLRTHSVPCKLVNCNNTYLHEQILRTMGIPDDEVNAEMDAIRPNYSVVEKEVV